VSDNVNDRNVHDSGGDDDRLDVVAVGNALVDVLARAPDEDLGRLGLLKGSMELVDLARSATVYGGMGAGVEVSGGSGANTAVGVAALGGRVGYIGKVADDTFGVTFLHDILAAGVEQAQARVARKCRRPGYEARCCAIWEKRVRLGHWDLRIALRGRNLSEVRSCCPPSRVPTAP